MIGALGINIKLLYTMVFGLGAALAGLAGLMQAPILTVQIGMGENILILAFVIIVIGGIGSIRGAFLAAIFVGIIDTMGRAFLPNLLRLVLSTTAASTAAPALSSMLIYLLMAIVLVVRPEGCFRPPAMKNLNAQTAATALMVAGCIAAAIFATKRQRLALTVVHAYRDLAIAAASSILIWAYGGMMQLWTRRLYRHRRYSTSAFWRRKGWLRLQYQVPVALAAREVTR